MGGDAMSWLRGKEKRRLMELERSNQELREGLRSLLMFAQEISMVVHVTAPFWGSHLAGLLEKFGQCDDYFIRAFVRRGLGELDTWKAEDNVVWLNSYIERFGTNNSERPDTETLHRLAFFLKEITKEVGVALPIYRRRMGMICEQLMEVDDREVRQLAEELMVSMPAYVEKRFRRGQQ